MRDRFTKECAKKLLLGKTCQRCIHFYHLDAYGNNIGHYCAHPLWSNNKNHDFIGKVCKINVMGTCDFWEGSKRIV